MSPLNPNPRVAEPTYGRDLLQSLPAALLAKPIVLTQPEPWTLVEGLFPAGAAQVHMVTNMEHDEVRARSEGFGAASAVFGVGGGSALDHAKYTAWVTGLPLVLVPSILSVDAAYTKAIGVREGRRVRYVGEVYPDHLLVDYALLDAAPAILNRAGAGDILSIFTALWDWREAGARLGEPYYPEIAARSQAILDRLYAAAAALREGAEEGYRVLSDCYVEEVRLCEMVGNSRPEEGSEHYLAYCIEHQTKRGYIHGQLVGLGVLLAGAHQGQDITPVRRYLESLGLDCRPAAVGVSAAELRRALVGLKDYVAQEGQLLPGVFHFEGGLDEAAANALIARVFGA